MQLTSGVSYRIRRGIYFYSIKGTSGTVAVDAVIEGGASEPLSAFATVVATPGAVNDDIALPECDITFTGTGDFTMSLSLVAYG